MPLLDNVVLEQSGIVGSCQNMKRIGNVCSYFFVLISELSAVPMPVLP